VIGNPEISTDGFHPYRNAIRDAFDNRATHGVIVKTYSVTNLAKDAVTRYSPAQVVAVEREVVSGIPSHISTSYVERQNLTLRMSQRRFTRLPSMARPPSPARAEPRISVNDLALYMVSSDTARIGIIRRAKNPQLPPIIRYRDVRGPICAFLADMRRDVNPLVSAEEMFRQRMADSSESTLRQDDARNSIEVLHAVQRMRNQLAPFEFLAAPAQQNRLQIGGVEVSVRADLLVHGTSRGADQIGAAVLRMTQDDADTDSAKTKRRDMGLYVATLARLHIDQNIATDREVANRLCMSIDVQHGEHFQAPDANTRRMNDLENACRFIAALWPTV